MKPIWSTVAKYSLSSSCKVLLAISRAQGEACFINRTVASTFMRIVRKMQSVKEHQFSTVQKNNREL